MDMYVLVLSIQRATFAKFGYYLILLKSERGLRTRTTRVKSFGVVKLDHRKFARFSVLLIIFDVFRDELGRLEAAGGASEAPSESLLDAFVGPWGASWEALGAIEPFLMVQSPLQGA